MARPRLGQFQFSPYPMDEDLQNELLAQSYAPNPLGELDAANSDLYGVDETDPALAAAYERLQARRRMPAQDLENPNASVGARISDILTGIGAVMQKRSPLSDIGAIQQSRLDAQRRQQEQALQGERMDMQQLANLARIRQQQKSLEQRPALEKQRAEASFMRAVELANLTGAQKMDLMDTLQKYRQAEKEAERAQKGEQFEKEAGLKRELETMRQKGAANRQANRNAQAKEGKPPSEFQSKFALYSKRLEMAENSLEGLMNSGFDPSSAKNAAFGFLPEMAKPEDVKEYENTKENFVSAILRPESGAAISKSEQQQAKKQYFPSIGDTPRVIEQKRLLRQQVINGMKAAAGKAYGMVETVPGQAPKSGKEGQKTLGGVKYEKRADGKWYPVQ